MNNNNYYNNWRQYCETTKNDFNRVGRVIMGDEQIRHREHGGIHHAGGPGEDYHAVLVSRDGHQKHTGRIEEQTSDVHAFGSGRKIQKLHVSILIKLPN